MRTHVINIAGLEAPDAPSKCPIMDLIELMAKPAVLALVRQLTVKQSHISS